MSTDTQIRHQVATSGLVHMAQDAEGQAVIQAMMSTVAYRDAELAVIRELWVNGSEAQAAEGVEGPVMVKLPDAQDPTLSFTDRGTGMTRDQAIDRYGFGVSSKRHDITATGEFGVGAKSIYAVSSQATVSTVHAGLLNVIVFSSQADGLKRHDALAMDVPTDAPNGTTVSLVPDDADPRKWRRAANSVLQWVDPSLVALVGMASPPPMRTTLVVNDRGDALLGYDGMHRDTIHVTMGRITYAVTSEEITKMGLEIPSRNARLRLHLENKSIDVLQSRDGVRLTTRTKDVLALAIRDFDEDLHTCLSRTLLDSTTTVRMAEVLLRIENQWTIDHARLMRGELSMSPVWVDDDDLATYSVLNDRTTAGGDKHVVHDYQRGNRLDPWAAVPRLWVSGTDQTRTAQLRTRIKHWMARSGTRDELLRRRSHFLGIVFVDELPPWLALLDELSPHDRGHWHVTAKELAGIEPIRSGTPRPKRDKDVVRSFRSASAMVHREGAGTVRLDGTDEELMAARIVLVVPANENKETRMDILRDIDFFDEGQILLLGPSRSQVDHVMAQLHRLGKSAAMAAEGRTRVGSALLHSTLHPVVRGLLAHQDLMVNRTELFVTAVRLAQVEGIESRLVRLVLQEVLAVATPRRNTSYWHDGWRYEDRSKAATAPSPVLAWLDGMPLLKALLVDAEYSKLTKPIGATMAGHLVDYINRH